jgi:hypothetical protein
MERIIEELFEEESRLMWYDLKPAGLHARERFYFQTLEYEYEGLNYEL